MSSMENSVGFAVDRAPVKASPAKCGLQGHRLMKRTLLKRSADQSASRATLRTVSNPNSRRTFQPLSRVILPWWSFELPFTNANHTIGSPVPAASVWDTIANESRSTSSCAVTKANQNEAPWERSRLRITSTPRRLASSGAKLSGAFRTTMDSCVVRLSFWKVDGINGASR